METIQEVKPEPVKEPTADDIGTRLEHLQDHREALEAIVDILKKQARPDPARLAKFIAALEVINVTVDAYSGYREAPTEYQLYRLINSVPKKGDEIEGGRGTPLTC